MALSPASSRAVAFTGGTISDPLSINAASGPGLTVAVASHDEAISVSSGTVASDYGTVLDVGSADGSLFTAYSDGTHDFVLYQADTNGFRVLNNAALGNPLVKANLSGFSLRYHAAPADGDLAAGECAIWFDQTNGAAKLMVKAKQANGTVVTGSLALA